MTFLEVSQKKKKKTSSLKPWKNMNVGDLFAWNMSLAFFPEQNSFKITIIFQELNSNCGPPSKQVCICLVSVVQVCETFLSE